MITRLQIYQKLSAITFSNFHFDGSQKFPLKFPIKQQRNRFDNLHIVIVYRSNIVSDIPPPKKYRSATLAALTDSGVGMFIMQIRAPQT